MLRCSKFLIAFLLMLVFTGGLFAQTAAVEPSWTKTTSGDYFHSTTTAVDSADTTFSTAFQLSTYNKSTLPDYPWVVEVKSSSASLKAVNYLQGSFYSTTGFTNVDSCNAADSTYYTGAKYQIDLNKWRLPFYRWMSVNVKGVTGTQYVRYNLYNAKKE